MFLFPFQQLVPAGCPCTSLPARNPPPLPTYQPPVPPASPLYPPTSPLIAPYPLPTPTSPCQTLFNTPLPLPTPVHFTPPPAYPCHFSPPPSPVLHFHQHPIMTSRKLRQHSISTPDLHSKVTLGQDPPDPPPGPLPPPRPLPPLPAPPTPLAAPPTNHLVVNGKRYQKLRLLGRGGSSKVFAVFDEESQDVRAIKLVNLEGLDQDTLTSYRNEILMLQELKECTRVIRLFDFEEMGNQLVLVMEKGEQGFCFHLE
ncbi:hypothetical protein O3P69_019505 [Scylla paramamosain]|uniref:Protein kinase domain-containing protein n=1 Tax=Scylla paramamosain TaxID=85552 RepID=A0AAW0SY30_SCYPA